MRLAFISNFINHHQIPFCNALYNKLGDEFIFIQTEPMEEERRSMHWEDVSSELPYVRNLFEETTKPLCEEWIAKSDVVIAGWTDRIDLVIRRMEQGKLTVRISERIYREGQWKAVSPRGLIAKYKEHTRFRRFPVYLLCAGAYVPSDFGLIRAYPDKMYRFGYFPESREYELDELMSRKDSEDCIQIVFAGRFLPLKHPEYMLELARDLKAEQESRAGTDRPLPDFRIHMVGDGQMEAELRSLTAQYRIEDCVRFYGFQTPEDVRGIMEGCHIHVFPSNELEGWGAVVNEAMNSGCVVVGSSRAGAIPYLIEQGVNGIAYPNNDYTKLKQAVLYLMLHDDEREAMGRAAYHTIVDSWNAQRAVTLLLQMIECWKKGQECCPREGPLSAAPVIAPKKMFQYMEEHGAGKDFNVG